MSTQSFSDIEFKSNPGQFNIDEAQGIVECFVAGIGNKDSVGDVLIPGAFTKSLTRRKPRVVWGHNWNDPIGKVLEIYEVPPSDPRLPNKMKAAGIGGLYARVQFNLGSEKGREAFSNVAFFGHDQEWSIGYKTLDAIFDQGIQANVLKEVELYEVSPVLHGANQLTGTISVKSDNLDEKCWPTAQGAPNSGDSEHSGLEAELMKRTGSAVKVRTASQNIAVFDRMTSDGKTSTYRIGYHFDGNQYMFGKPEAVTTQTVYTPEQGQSGSRVVVPSQMPSMPMNVKPQGDAYLGDDPGEQRPGTGIIVPPMGRILPKDASDSAFGEELDDLSSLLGDDFGAKVGKVISSRNLSKLKNVLSILEEIVVASDKDVETKSELLIPVEIENAFAAKTALDPIFEYHRVETEVTEKGIVVKSGVTPDFINAINTATKGLGPALGRGGGNLPKVRSAGRALTGTFDPNAWDGDGDGLVQEGTAFERPAVPGVNDRATRGVVNAIDAVRSAEKLGINTGNKEGLSSSRNPSSPDFYNSVGRWPDGNGLNRLDSEIMSHLIKSGDNNEDAAKHFNVPEITIELAKKRETQRLKRNDKFHRNKDILTYRMGGLSLEDTAKLFGDTRENIRKGEQQEISHLRNDMSNDEFENLRRSGMTLDSLSKITGKSREELRKTEMKNRSDSRKRTQEISKANADRRDGLASRFFGGKDKTPKPDDSKAIEVPKPRKPLNTDGWKKWNSGRSGSQVGGSFEDASGNKFYVKEPHSQSHAEQEVLAAQLYRLLGVSAADVQLGDYKGKTKIVSPWIDNSKNNVLSPQKRDQAWRKKVQAGYVADAWLANWDVLGTGWDNIIADGNGDPVRVDTGGSLGYRARGAAKGSAFGNTAGEMESLLDARKNPSSADYFGDIPKDEIERQVAELEKLQPDQIRQMVDGYISDKNEAKKLSDTLIARRQDIIDRYGAPKRKPIQADGLDSGTGVRQPRSRAEIDKYPRGVAPPNYPDSPSRDTFSHLESENSLTTGLGFEIPITSDDVKHSVTYSDSAMKHRQKAFEALETEDMHDGPGKALAAAKAEIVKGLAAGDISEKEAYETYHELGSRAEDLINSGVGSGVELERNATALKNFKFEAASQVDDWVNQSTRNLKDISSDIDKVREEPGRVSADKSIKEAYDAIDLVGNKYGQVGWAGSMREDNPHTPKEIMDELNQDVNDIISHLQDAEDNDPGRDHRKDIDQMSKKLGKVLDGHVNDGSIDEKQKEELLKTFVDATDYLAQTGEASDTISTMHADETKLSRSRIEGLASSARTKLMSNEGVTETDKRKVQAVAARTMLNRPGQIQRDENGNIASTEARDMREKLDAGIFKKLADLGFSDDEISALTGVPNGGRPIKKGQTVNGLSSSVLSGNDKFINFDRGALENILESRNPKPKIIKPRKSSQHGPTGLEDLTDEELLAELSKHNKPAWRPWGAGSNYVDPEHAKFAAMLRGEKDNSASFNQIVRELDARGFTVEEHGPREAKFFGDYSSGDTSYIAHNKDTGVNTQGAAAKKIIDDLKTPSGGLQSSSRDDSGLPPKRPHAFDTIDSFERVKRDKDRVVSDMLKKYSDTDTQSREPRPRRERGDSGLRSERGSGENVKPATWLKDWSTLLSELDREKKDRGMDRADSPDNAYLALLHFSRLDDALNDAWKVRDDLKKRFANGENVGSELKAVGNMTTRLEGERLNHAQRIMPKNGVDKEDVKKLWADRSKPKLKWNGNVSTEINRGLQSSSRDDVSYARELKKQREIDAARGVNATNPVGKVEKESSPNKQMGMNLSELDEMKKTIDRLIEGSVGATTSQDGSKDEDLRRLEELAGKIDESHVAVDYVHMSAEELNNYMETLQNMRDEPGVQDLYDSLDKVKKSTDGVYESPKVQKQGLLDSSGKKPTRSIASSAAKRGLSRNKEVSTNTHPKLEMTLTSDEIGLLRDDIAAVKKFATDTSALDALDEKLSGATNGKIDITNSDYDALTESIEKAKKDSNGKLITSDVLGVIGQAADSEDGKFVSPNFESEKQGLSSEVPKPGRRLNNGAPSDIPENMQKDLMYWARQQRGLRIAQDIVREHDANDGQMPPSRWKALRTMHQNMGPGSARNGMRSSVGTNGGKKPQINAAREGLSSDLGGGSLGLGDGSLNMTPTGEGGRGRGVGRAAGLGDIGKRGNEEGRQVGSGAQQDPRFVGKNFDELKPDNWDEMSTTDKLDWMFYEGSPSKSGMRQVDHTRIVNELTAQEEIDAKRAERRTRLDAQKASRPQSESMLPNAGDGEKSSAVKRAKDSSTIRKFSSTRADEMLGHVDDGKLSQTHADAWSDIEKALGDKDELTTNQIKAAKDSIDKLIHDADIEGDDSRAAKYSIDQAEKLKKVLDAYDSAAPKEGMDSRTGPSEKAKKAVPSYQKYLTAKASNSQREGLRSGTNPTGKEGRTMITDEATYFKDVESSLVKEIDAAKKANDTKTSSGLSKLQEIIRRQEASRTGDRRTNVGSIFLTQEESDQILDALMVALDRQVERGSTERQDLYSKMIEHIAKAAMSTFIDKSTREIGSRTQKRTGGRDGRTVNIPNTNL